MRGSQAATLAALLLCAAATSLLLLAGRRLRYSPLFRPNVPEKLARERQCADAAAAYLRQLRPSSASGPASSGRSAKPSRSGRTGTQQRLLLGAGAADGSGKCVSGGGCGQRSLRQAEDAAQGMLCINVLASPRPGDGAGYLLQSVASLLHGLSLEEEAPLVALQILLAAPAASFSPDTLTALHGIAAVSELPCATAGRSAGLNAAACYAQALTQCPPAARHVLIVEDDAVAAVGFHQQLAPALRLLAASSEPWLYLKLWYTDFWWGWENEDAPTLAAIGMSAGGAGAATAFRLSRQLRTRPQRRLLLAAACGAAIAAAAVGSLLLLGKQHVPLLRRRMPHGLAKASHRCCTPAQAYPIDVTAGLADHLAAASRDAPYDLLIDDYADAHHLQRYTLAPHPFQHIGRVSARGDKAAQASLPLEDQYRRLKTSPDFAGGALWCAPLLQHLRQASAPV